MSTRLPVLWLLGPTSAGKTTLGRALCKLLRRELTVPVLHLDGDEIRDIFDGAADFSPEGRLRVVRGLVMMADKASEAGVLAIVSALTANENARNFIRRSLPTVLTAYVSCPQSVCMARDPKGLYRQAAAGEIDTLIGFNTPYIPPADPEIVIDTGVNDTQTCVSQLASFIKSRLRSEHMEKS